MVAVAGGTVVLLDRTLKEIWRVDGFRNDFGHEFYTADINGEGADEIAFCTVDHINTGYTRDEDWNAGELVVLDHTGATLFRRRVDEYCSETHFDDLAFGDFRGKGQVELLTEKGQLLDAYTGNVIWDVSGRFDHGQWIAHVPNRTNGRTVFITELWGSNGKSALFTGHGDLIADVQRLPRTMLNPRLFPGWRVLPTRCHAVRWSPDSEPQFFMSEQACAPTSHSCFRTRHFALTAFFVSAEGELIGTMPFEDSQIEGYWYNGEVRSRVADVDGDGHPEVVFPRQNGRVAIIKKKSL